MKFDIYLDGVRLESWADATITLDAQFSSAAAFAVHSAGNGPWINNLSKVRINGRECRPETSTWGFEETPDLGAWRVRGEAGALRLDATESAFGIGSAALDWTPLTQAAVLELYHAFPFPANGNGLVFWGWLHAAYANAAVKPVLYALPYAKDVTGAEWAAAARVPVAEANGWTAVGLRLQASAVQPATPGALVEIGFRLSHAADVPLGAALATVRLDAVSLCGRAYPEGVQLPPFAADGYAGAVAPFQPLTCKKWDQSTWEDGMHLETAHWAWCPKGTVWDDFLWADERNPSGKDSQWA